MSAAPTPEIDTAKPVPRWEWVVVLGVVLVAAGVRFCFPGRLAVEHFDEGVYASNIWFADRPGGVYPEQHLYAPPMLPALIEWGFVFLGPSNSAAMWPNQLAGIVTVILLWWLGRSWFGQVAGLTAATLCAASEVHILLSRSALTDALLGMWWVAALIALRRACDSGRWRHGLLAGYLVGMAWYTKYNGWMPLGITFAAVIARGVCCRGIRPQTRRALKGCLIAGVIAFATWSPWLWSLQTKGGYASVMANHRQYVVGASGWLSSFERQWSQIDALMRTISPIVLGAAYLIMCTIAVRRAKVLGTNLEIDFDQGEPVVDPAVASKTVLEAFIPHFTWRGIFTTVLMFGFAFPVVAQFGLTLQALILWWLWARCRQGERWSIRSDDLGYWLLLVWFFGLLIATPLYRPYLRLTLPWLLTVYCGVGLAFHLAWTSVWCESNPFNSYRFLRNWTIQRACVFVLFGAMGLWMTRGLPGQSRPAKTIPLSDQSAFVDAARQLSEKIKEAIQPVDSIPVPAAVYVYGEPGLLFQLRNAGLMNVGPTGSLQFLRGRVSVKDKKVFLAVGVHAKSDPNFLEQFAAHRQQLKWVGSWPWPLGPLVALDQPTCDPRLLGVNPEEAATIELYEVREP